MNRPRVSIWRAAATPSKGGRVVFKRVNGGLSGSLQGTRFTFKRKDNQPLNVVSIIATINHPWAEEKVRRYFAKTGYDEDGELVDMGMELRTIPRYMPVVSVISNKSFELVVIKHNKKPSYHDKYMRTSTVGFTVALMSDDSGSKVR
jgi:hypothetical protein